jgi:hypothetical protein
MSRWNGALYALTGRSSFVVHTRSHPGLPFTEVTPPIGLH